MLDRSIVSKRHYLDGKVRGILTTKYYNNTIKLSVKICAEINVKIFKQQSNILTDYTSLWGKTSVIEKKTKLRYIQFFISYFNYIFIISVVVVIVYLIIIIILIV